MTEKTKIETIEHLKLKINAGIMSHRDRILHHQKELSDLNAQLIEMKNILEMFNDEIKEIKRSIPKPSIWGEFNYAFEKAVDGDKKSMDSLPKLASKAAELERLRWEEEIND